MARSEAGNNVVYVHAGQQVIADYARGAAAAAPSFRYVYGSYVDEPLLRHAGTGTTLPTSGTAALYYHRNQQYSIVGLSDAAGTLVERYAYTAYGELTILAPDRTLRPTSSFENRYTYTGREWDSTLRLYYFRARWLEPKAGRFIGRDPLGYVDGMGLYGAYFAGDGLDPYGYWRIKRSGGPKAIAISEEGDSIASLADIIGLNVKEYEKWLTFPRQILGTSVVADLNGESSNSFKGPYSDPTEKLCPGLTFEIPNTIVVNFAGDLEGGHEYGDFLLFPGMGPIWASWSQQLGYLTKLGFNVSPYSQTGKTGSAMPQASYYGLIQSTASQKELHGLFAWGHGAELHFHSGKYTQDPIYWYHDINTRLQYKLALVVINACQSDNINSRKLISDSPGSIFEGHKQICTPIRWNGKPIFGDTFLHYLEDVIEPPMQGTGPTSECGVIE